MELKIIVKIAGTTFGLGFGEFFVIGAKDNVKKLMYLKKIIVSKPKKVRFGIISDNVKLLKKERNNNENFKFVEIVEKTW